MARLERIRATLEGKPVQVESQVEETIRNLNGSKVVLVERTPREIVSRVTGRSLGRKEIIIGEGVIQNGEIRILDSSGRVLHVAMSTVPKEQRRRFFPAGGIKVKQKKSNRVISGIRRKGIRSTQPRRITEKAFETEKTVENMNGNQLILRVMG